MSVAYEKRNYPYNGGWQDCYSCCPTLRAEKRRIYKLEILQPFTAEQRIPLKEGYQVVYNLEMIFALAFQINTYPAQQLRKYIISRLFQTEKSMVICMVNGNHKSYLKC